MPSSTTSSTARTMTLTPFGASQMPQMGMHASDASFHDNEDQEQRSKIIIHSFDNTSKLPGSYYERAALEAEEHERRLARGTDRSLPREFLVQHATSNPVYVVGEVPRSPADVTLLSAADEHAENLHDHEVVLDDTITTSSRIFREREEDADVISTTTAGETTDIDRSEDCVGTQLLRRRKGGAELRENTTTTNSKIYDTLHTTRTVVPCSPPTPSSSSTTTASPSRRGERDGLQRNLGPWNCLYSCTTVAERIEAIWGEPATMELRSAKQAVLARCTGVKVALLEGDEGEEAFVLYSFRDGSTFFGGPPLALELRAAPASSKRRNSKPVHKANEVIEVEKTEAVVWAGREPLSTSKHLAVEDCAASRALREWYRIHNGAGLILSEKHLQTVVEKPLEGCGFSMYYLFPLEVWATAVVSAVSGERLMKSSAGKEEKSLSCFRSRSRSTTSKEKTTNTSLPNSDVSVDEGEVNQVVSSGQKQSNLQSRRSEHEIKPKPFYRPKRDGAFPLIGRMDKNCLVCCHTDEDVVGYVDHSKNSSHEKQPEWSRSDDGTEVEACADFIESTISNFVGSHSMCVHR
ncbi:unnamed protein product [Amoebophrya sp. A25]|nr:unnamed protein product [Amoebophrya sp. A25]|eukprot:GSA25T00012507001.1